MGAWRHGGMEAWKSLKGSNLNRFYDLKKLKILAAVNYYLSLTGHIIK